MTVLGTGLVVWSSCILFGLVDGLEHSLTISGDPLDLIVMRKGSTNETTGGFETSKADELLNLPGIARDEQGRPLAAKELLNIPIAERRTGPGPTSSCAACSPHRGSCDRTSGSSRGTIWSKAAASASSAGA